MRGALLEEAQGSDNPRDIYSHEDYVSLVHHSGQVGDIPPITCNTELVFASKRSNQQSVVRSELNYFSPQTLHEFFLLHCLPYQKHCS